MTPCHPIMEATQYELLTHSL